MDLSNNTVQGPCRALLVDVAPQEQQGLGSAWFSFMLGALHISLLRYFSLVFPYRLRRLHYSFLQFCRNGQSPRLFCWLFGFIESRTIYGVSISSIIQYPVLFYSLHFFFMFYFWHPAFSFLLFFSLFFFYFFDTFEQHQ